MKERVGFIGLGIMGKPMARNLLRAGFALTVYNRSEAPIRELEKEGAQGARSSKEVGDRSDVVITILPDSPDVEMVVLGPNGILEGIRPGSVIIDMSTISPLVSRTLAGEAAKRGIKMLDAPVSGGEKGAIEGTLSIMVGGDREAFERCLPIFHAMGKRVVYMGESGAGGFTKLANQIIVGITLEAIAEGLVLGMKAGVDPERMIEALGGGMAGSRCLELKGPSILERDFRPGFKIDLHFKDLGLALEAGRDLGVPLPFTPLVKEMFAALRVKGKGGIDHSGIITLLEELAQVQVRKLA